MFTKLIDSRTWPRGCCDHYCLVATYYDSATCLLSWYAAWEFGKVDSQVVEAGQARRIQGQMFRGDLSQALPIRYHKPRYREQTHHPDSFEWITRPHEPGEPARHVVELSERAKFAHTRASVWRCEPGARGRRHRHPTQEETFVVLAGTLSMYVGDPPRRQDVPTGGLIHIDAGTPLQTMNHGGNDLLVYVYGYPPESENAEILDPASPASKIRADST